MKLLAVTLLAALASCSASRYECDAPEDVFVSSIGGCDAEGFCGVTLESAKDGAFIHEVMRYPVKGAIIIDYMHCYIPYKRPEWMTFK